MLRIQPYLVAPLLLTCGPVAASSGWDGDRERDQRGVLVLASPYTFHYSEADPDEKRQRAWLFGVVGVRADGWLAGGAAFENSFGQPCAYGFVGRRYVEPFGWRNVYWTWTAGVVYGYRPPYQDKLPVNLNGWAPVVIPTVGYQLTRQLSAEFIVLGTSALMFSISFRAP
jgi:hypothetical protein